jgi:hypothetical protein
VVKWKRIRIDVYYKDLKPHSIIQTHTTDVFIPIIDSKEKIIGYKIREV